MPGGNQIGGSDVQPILPNPPNQNEPVLFQPPILDQGQTPPSLLTRVIHYTYDNLDRLTSAAYTDNNTPTFNYQYTYDFNSNRTFALGQNFLSATNPTFQATTSFYNLANQLTTSTDQNGSTAFTYNADGTLAGQVTNNSYNPNAPSTSTTYAYDLADRLTNVTAPNGSTTGYTYDGMGDRVSASTHTGSTSTYTTYLVDPSGSIPQILAEYPNSGLPTYYIPAGTLIGQDQGAGTNFFATDGLGSVRGTYNTSGANVGVSNFDPYGAILPDYAVTGTGSHIGYTGAMTDSNGLVYLNARYYNPGIGDFLSSDPLAGQPADPATFNLYTYVQDNPINAFDPSGKAESGCPDGNECGGEPSSGDYATDTVNYSTNASGQAVNAQGQIIGYDPVTNITVNADGTITNWGTTTPDGQPFASPNGITTNSVGSNILASPGDTVQSAVDRADASLTGNTDTNTGDTKADDSGATCSFTPDTVVDTAQGELPISSLKVGDHVLAYDPETAKIALKAIDAVLVHIDLKLKDLTIDGEVIHTTPNHPFYTQDKGWVAAGNLNIGEEILKADGSYGKVQALKAIDHAQVMYNLTVHDDHDYFVGIGQWLVHNGEDCSGQRPPYSKNPAHDPNSPNFNSNKTPEPADAVQVYNRSIQSDQNGNWYGLGQNGEIYRFSPDNTGSYHFSGMTGSGTNSIRMEDIPIAIRRALGRIR